MIIKKYDEEKKVYLCKLKNIDDDKEKDKKNDAQEIEVNPDDLSEHLVINTRIITENKQAFGQIQVGINDFIDNLKNFFKDQLGNLNVIYKGEVVKKEDTYAKRQILSLSSFLLVPGGYSALKFNRFNGPYSTSFWYMSESVWDSLMFIPLINIQLLGFGMCNHHQKKDFSLIFKYHIDEDFKTEEHKA